MSTVLGRGSQTVFFCHHQFRGYTSEFINCPRVSDDQKVWETLVQGNALAEIFRNTTFNKVIVSAFSTIFKACNFLGFLPSILISSQNMKHFRRHIFDLCMFNTVAYLEFTKGGPTFDKLKSCNEAESQTEFVVGVRMFF